MAYKIQLILKTDTHPGKWFLETVDQVLTKDEDILECEIELLDNSEDG